MSLLSPMSAGSAEARTHLGRPGSEKAVGPQMEGDVSG